jgi:hypothetical protein
MKTFIIFMLLWITASPLNAEETKQFIPLECFPINPFLENFQQHYGEELVFMSGSVNARDEELYHQLWMNPSTQTWTFMVSNKPRELICVIASGTGFANIPQGNPS